LALFLFQAMACLALHGIEFGPTRSSGWSTVPVERDHVLPHEQEARMFGKTTIGRDPYEGSSAYRRRMRERIEGLLALGLAIVACGLIAAMWLRTLSPLFERLLG
jgi:hypothetical protein